MLAHRPGHSPAMLDAALLQHTLHYVVPEGVASKGGLVLKDRSGEVLCERRWAPFNQVLQDTAAIGMPGEISGRHRRLREEQAKRGGPAMLADAMRDVIAVLVIHQVLQVGAKLCYHWEANLVITDLHEPLHHTTCMHIHGQLQPFTSQHIHQRPLMILTGPLQHSNQRILAMLVPGKLRSLAKNHAHNFSITPSNRALDPTPRARLCRLLNHRLTGLRAPLGRLGLPSAKLRGNAG
mmetsp:Transcript_92933/g.212657  ORF Transcript_92933/g.212657 Transcript_92933/m.212657 type:complete len:237 (-) Transcript_92933:376-1086(-)